MEVVIAIGVVAVVIPLILSALGSASGSRRNAEADTRSAWLAKEVQRDILRNWAKTDNGWTDSGVSVIDEDLDFPVIAKEDAPKVLIYDSEGEFLQEGEVSNLESGIQVKDAAYVVSVYSEIPTDVNGDLIGPVDGLALLRIEVQYPARSKPEKRTTYHYHIMTPREGVL
ncbi:MAG: hypothetical protein ACSHX7_13465 [Luteolibacter sp.]